MDEIEQTGDTSGVTAGQNAAAVGGTNYASGAYAGLSLIGTLFGAYGKHKAGRVNEKLLEYNAAVAEYQAEDTVRRGVVAESRRRDQTKQVIGAQRVSLARQGVDINEGSALTLQGDAAYLGELDALTIRNNAAREAWGYKVQAQDAGMRGDFARIAGDQEAAATILTGSSNILLSRYGFGRSALSPDPLLVR